ncbi:MAG: ATP-grasp domain-containing protein [Clostridia bacterium]|nr:ATP-grasp domain-containing protein [Clostridia bacterium]
MKTCWLLYETKDLAVNRDYAAMMQQYGLRYNLAVEPVTLDELTLGMTETGEPFAIRDGRPARPDAVLSRMRLDWVSEHLERMGVPVFNNSKVCRICNDKRRTHLFLQGLPMAETVFPTGTAAFPGTPRVLKPSDGHGGKGVQLISDADSWQTALADLQGQGNRPILHQAVVDAPGRDLRVYVLFGRILAGVMRTAKEGIISNFKLGGSVGLHTLTKAEQELAQAVIDRFHAAGAPLHMAGVDLLYTDRGPVISEVEDVVGSRMLYKVSDIDLADRYLAGIAERI